MGSPSSGSPFRKRLLPLLVAVWHKDVGKRVLKPIAKGDDVLVYGQLVRRFYRSEVGARSLREVVAAGIKKIGTRNVPLLALVIRGLSPQTSSSPGSLRSRLAADASLSPARFGLSRVPVLLAAAFYGLGQFPSAVREQVCVLSEHDLHV